MSNGIVWGFTGTRNAPTEQQLQWLDLYMFDHDVDEAHHGACVGADLAFHRVALNYAVPIIVHPPLKEAYLAFECLEPHELVTVLARKHYHIRNEDIVNVSNAMIALPNSPYRPGSGTWHAIGYAMYRKVPVTVCYPDGFVETR